MCDEQGGKAPANAIFPALSSVCVMIRVAGRLLDRGIARRQDIEYVLNARIPLIKFRDSRHGTCISISTLTGVL